MRRSLSIDASKSCNLDQTVVCSIQRGRRQTLAHFGSVVKYRFALLQFENGNRVHTLSLVTTISKAERNFSLFPVVF
jgi:hypothetical protein